VQALRAAGQKDPILPVADNRGDNSEGSSEFGLRFHDRDRNRLTPGESTVEDHEIRNSEFGIQNYRRGEAIGVFGACRPRLGAFRR